MQQSEEVAHLPLWLYIDSYGFYHSQVGVLDPFAALDYKYHDHALECVIEIDSILRLPLTPIVQTIPLIADELLLLGDSHCQVIEQAVVAFAGKKCCQQDSKGIHKKQHDEL